MNESKTITIKSWAELETVTDAELAAYDDSLEALLKELSGARWIVDMERWMRECPIRLAEREASNAALIERMRRAEAEFIALYGSDEDMTTPDLANAA